MIRRNLRILRRVTAANIAIAVSYRSGFVLFMAANIVVPVISLLVWRAALANGANLPVDEGYLTTYFVLLSFVTMATASWLARFLAEDIRLGRLSRWLIRPVSPLHNLIASNLAEKLIKALALVPMIGLLAVVFADSMRVPANPLRWLLFAISVLLGAVLVFAISVLIGSLGFWFDDVAGIDAARVLVANLLSGAVVPLVLMPQWARGFIAAQPFRFTVSFPVELVLGQLSRHQVVTGFAWQLGYVVGLCLLARAVWSAGLRTYSAVGT